MLHDRVGVPDFRRRRILHEHAVAIDVDEPVRLFRRHGEQGTGFNMVPCPTERTNCLDLHGYEVLALVATTNDFG